MESEKVDMTKVRQLTAEVNMLSSKLDMLSADLNYAPDELKDAHQKIINFYDARFKKKVEELWAYVARI